MILVGRLDGLPNQSYFLFLNSNVSWCLLLLLLAFLPSFTLLRTHIPSTTLLGPSLEFWNHLGHVKHHILTYTKITTKNSDVSSQWAQKTDPTDSCSPPTYSYTHIGLTGGKFLQTEAAISLLQLNSNTTPELSIPVPFSRMHFVVLPKQTGKCIQTHFGTSKKHLHLVSLTSA